MKRFMRLISLIGILAMCFFSAAGEEMPKPNYDNSLIFSITHYFLNETPTELQYIIDQYGNGIYAPLFFSKFENVYMDWSINPASGSSGIPAFKSQVDKIVAFAKTYKVGVHITLNYGLSRNVNNYKTAKQQDIRNAQWYNDNNISSLAQMGRTSASQAAEMSPLQDLDHTGLDAEARPGRSEASAPTSAINEYVFTTFSRYARKLRAHAEAAMSASFLYLKQVQTANPGVTIIVSAPGEAELNFKRINDTSSLQEFFCDYSPFTVLEFRDWIKHEGMYAVGGKYAGQGYSAGGARYQGASGLANFNADFKTAFTSWDLKYYNWSLSDAVDVNYSDATDPDPRKISVAQYVYDGMKPTSGAGFINGGFDPPRVMKQKGADVFYDLWARFREIVVYNYAKDVATLLRASGFPSKQFYTHQIPGDYLFGTRPNDPLIPQLNPRYYAGAAPLWTAYVHPDVGMGVTLYDVNLGGWIARTTKYGITGAAVTSSNWAALEYNPEVIPAGIPATLSSAAAIYDEMIRLYQGNPHVISFFKWKGDSYAYRDTNRGAALSQFFSAIKDKGRKQLPFMYTPKTVESFAGAYNATTYLVDLTWSSKIWSDLTHTWSNWGDFKEFAIYRGYTPGFVANSSSLATRTTAAKYTDYGFLRGTTVYYKIIAINKNDQVGPAATVSVVVPTGSVQPILSVSRGKLTFGALAGGSNPAAQKFIIANTGTGALMWDVQTSVPWLAASPASGFNGAEIAVTANISGLSAGSYNGTLTISATGALDSPKTISVNLFIKNANQNAAPFGEFATPESGASVCSNIPVTGWALDDLGVQSVKIYRDPLPAEGKNLIFIGDASFVEGARPDVENAFPDYPANYKAGWGYMMLTNFLPNNGNGVFKFYAIAADITGKQATLGTKTITVDNASAARPFGTIETPDQGGAANGAAFRNWGWALTPPPAMIPINGSTISVFVDGLNIGHPHYNFYREDVAALFPNYLNKNGAFGYFDIDATRYNDGVHTLSWVVSDNSGNTDGIGSRYFTILNNISSRKDTQQRHTAPPSLYLPGALSSVPEQTRAINRKIEETETFSIQLNGPWEMAFMTSDNGRRSHPLPVGSTFDSQKGVFYWSPGPGFTGRYVFEFVRRNPVTRLYERCRAIVDISPRFSLKPAKTIHKEN